MPAVGRRWHPRIWAVALGLWLLPVVAQRLLSGMDWGAGDFLAYALMLLAAAIALELAMRWLGSRRQRVVAGLVIAGAFATLWAELAVNIVGPG